jgi:hypothetical protein
MSIGLTDVARKEFDDEVKQVYQGKQTLRQTVTQRNNVVGSTYNFRRMGKGLANQKAIQSLVTPMNVDHSMQVATLQDWLAPEYTDIFAQATVNFDEKTELAKSIGMALGRRDDQLVIDELEDVSVGSTGVFPATVDTGYYIDGGTSEFEVALLVATRVHYAQLETDDQVYCVCASSALDGMLNDSTITSSDYNSVKALVAGEIDSFMGFKFKIIGTRAEGGITQTDANNHFAYFYTKASVGMAIGLDIRTSIDWVPERTSWLVNGLLKAGAVVREPQAVIKLQYSPSGS